MAGYEVGINGMKASHHGESCAFDDELNLIGDVLSPVWGEYNFSLALYDHSSKMVVSRGLVYIPGVLPENLKENSGVLSSSESHTHLFYWKILPDQVGMFFVVSLKKDGHVEVDEHILSAVGRIGVHIFGQNILLNKFSIFLRQSIRERDAVSGLIEDGLLVLDQSGFLKYINEAGKKILKIDDAKRQFRDLLGFEPIIGDVFTQKRGYVNKKVVILRGEDEIPLVDTAIPIADDDGRIVSVVNIFRRFSTAPTLPDQGLREESGIGFDKLLGASTLFQNAIETAKQYAGLNEALLISGEPGTGKSTFAQALHGVDESTHKEMRVIDCSRLSVADFKDKILCYVITDDQVGRWEFHPDIFKNRTLFIDGVDVLPISIQLYLLQALKEHQHTSGLKILMATTDTMGVVLHEQRLHPKLLGILSRHSLELPPLRKRPKDVELYASFFWNEENAQGKRSTIPVRLGKLLKKQDWKENISQLKRVVRQLANAPRRFKSEAEYTNEINDLIRQSAVSHQAISPDFDQPLMHDAEKQAIFLALQAMNFNVSKAALALGISRPTLYSKMKKYEISA
ncbi:sigma 54-interacting transcriptional regulator [Pseudomonas cichorii]|uniref:sigma 54-interacting transcriptional regulator n=1 Tax=Pseudomonas cichorii TaxID=36746 RepID=UPI001C8A226B|nr:sigma 54-interacting transcriptional regulator [Pseudomonas cichorii]MBX8517906.1 sigma 54-interacting transcriptional regulator [Pseudomonas cichorii]